MRKERCYEEKHKNACKIILAFLFYFSFFLFCFFFFFDISGNINNAKQNTSLQKKKKTSNFDKFLEYESTYKT